MKKQKTFKPNMSSEKPLAQGRGQKAIRKGARSVHKDSRREGLLSGGGVGHDGRGKRTSGKPIGKGRGNPANKRPGLI